MVKGKMLSVRMEKAKRGGEEPRITITVKGCLYCRHAHWSKDS